MNGVLRGFLLSLACGAIGLLAGIATRPYQDTTFWTQDQAVQAVGAMMVYALAFFGVGLFVGLVLHFVLPRTARKDASNG